eukprot:SAG25_NODE_236_length_11287_cov_246.398999_13_plen_62_part_00
MPRPDPALATSLAAELVGLSRSAAPLALALRADLSIEPQLRALRRRAAGLLAESELTEVRW